MKYVLLEYVDVSAKPEYTPEQAKAAIQAWVEFDKEARAAGVLVSNETLRADDTTTVRFRNGETVISDGPFAETHEQIGGIFTFSCKDLDEAISWASKMPGAKYGTIEIRPVWEYSQSEW